MSRFWRAAGRGSLAAILVVLIVAMNRADPTYEERTRPLAEQGAVGERIDTGPFSVTVEDVDVARSVTLGSDTFATKGMWVIARVTATADREPLDLERVALYTRDGYTYVSQDPGAWPYTLDNVHLQPGIPRHGPLLFELPSDQLAGAELRISTGRALLGAQARIDLGFDQERAARLVADAPGRYEVAEVEFR